MKVACFIPSFPVGSQGFILGQITGLIDRGCEVDIFAHTRADLSLPHPDVERYRLLDRSHFWAPSRSRLRRAARYTHRLTREAARNPRLALRSLSPRLGRDLVGTALLFAETERLRDDRYDVLHCHFGTAATVPALLRELLGLRARLVTTFYGHDVTRYPLQHRGCYSKLFARGDHFLALSRCMLDRLVELGCPEHRASVHHLGVRCDEIAYEPRRVEPGEPVRLVSVARLVEKKGLEYAIRAVAKLRERKLDAELHVVGEGPERPRLEDWIDRLELRDRVTLHGRLAQPDAIRVLRSGHVFVQPSVTARDGDEEGTPTAILEAMATGMPVVATRHAGIPEQIEEGVSGWLVPERDVDRLAERLAEVVCRPDLWPEIGRAARLRVESRFDSAQLSSEQLELYGRLRRLPPRRHS